MESERVSVDAYGKLELAATDAVEHALAAPDAPKTRAPKPPARDAVEQPVAERALQQEAEHTIVAEAREQATSAEPPESGALTTEPPIAD